MCVRGYDGAHDASDCVTIALAPCQKLPGRALSSTCRVTSLCPSSQSPFIVHPQSFFHPAANLPITSQQMSEQERRQQREQHYATLAMKARLSQTYVKPQCANPGSDTGTESRSLVVSRKLTSHSSGSIAKLCGGQLFARTRLASARTSTHGLGATAAPVIRTVLSHQSCHQRVSAPVSVSRDLALIIPVSKTRRSNPLVDCSSCH